MRRLHFHQVLALGWLVAFGVGTVALAVPAYAGLAEDRPAGIAYGLVLAKIAPFGRKRA